MDAEPEPLRKTSRDFPTTRWSLVLRAGQSTSEESRTALAELCRAYWYPLYSFVRRKGNRAEDAEDLVQGFFAKFLAAESTSRVDQDKGRFRSYLLGAMTHHLRNEESKARAEKRGGGRQPLPLEMDFADGERRFVAEPTTGLTPEQDYDRRWALTLMDRALVTLRTRYADHGKAAQFDELSRFLAGEDDEVSYREAGQRLSMSEGAVKVAVHRLRKRFREALREEIAHTVSSDAAVEAEMCHFLAALGS